MERRTFVQWALAGVAWLARTAAFGAGLERMVASTNSAHLASEQLFPVDLPELTWKEFTAAGFSEQVAGLIHRARRPSCCGVPLGGISTGCLDVQVGGVLGFSTLFQSYPRKPQLLAPFLANAVGDRTWVLATKQFCEGGTIQGCWDPRFPAPRALPPGETLKWTIALPKLVVHSKTLSNPLAESTKWMVTLPRLTGVEPVRDIHYWGHYPIADIEYDTDAPISVGMRAWAPFIPGDVEDSAIPGAVFEIHLRNRSNSTLDGTLAFNFPGPTQAEAQFVEHAPIQNVTIAGHTWPAPVTKGSYLNPTGEGADAIRKRVQGLLNGISVHSKAGVGYCVGVKGEDKV